MVQMSGEVLRAIFLAVPDVELDLYLPCTCDGALSGYVEGHAVVHTRGDELLRIIRDGMDPKGYHQLRWVLIFGIDVAIPFT